MKKTTKKNTGDIVNFYDRIPKKYLDESENHNFDSHHIKLPFRMCVVAPSGSGKTNFILNLLKVFGQGKGTFVDVNIITANKDEPLYNYLAGEFEAISIKEGVHSTPKLDSFDKKFNHLVIWDDLVLSKNLDMVEQFFLRCRKLNVSVCFLSQDYYCIPKFIRKNSNYLVILHLGGSKREKTAIMNEWGSGLDKDELDAVYQDATKEHMRPLIIEGGKCDINKKFRKGWNDFYNMPEFLKDIPRTDSKGLRKKKKEIKSESDSD
jgi:hypothetical protein